MRLHCQTIALLTGNPVSTLAGAADILQVFPDFREACGLGLAPTSSTTVEMCYGDSLAVVLSKTYGFTDANFGSLHPAGSLGKKILLKVSDIMAMGDDNAIVPEDASLKDAIIELGKKKLGMVSVLSDNDKLLGIFTNGDLRRLFENEKDIYKLQIAEVMNKTPFYVYEDELAYDALTKLRDNDIWFMPVLSRENKAVGTIVLHDIVKAGIV